MGGSPPLVFSYSVILSETVFESMGRRQKDSLISKGFFVNERGFTGRREEGKEITLPCIVEFRVTKKLISEDKKGRYRGCL